MSKEVMYRNLEAGMYGNTLPMWRSVEEFESVALKPWKSYGIRSMTPRGTFNAFVKECDVKSVCYSRSDKYVISPMIDDIAHVTLWANVYEDEAGLNVEYVEHPERGVSWREGMQHPLKVSGVLARRLLRHHLNTAAMDDLDILINNYPRYVIELSAMDRCLGTVPGRNAIIWEVRGDY